MFQSKVVVEEMDFKKLKSVFVIAEIGQNHQGDIETAKKMIYEAHKAGVDCVKFQKSCLEQKFTQTALERPYVTKNSWGATYGEHKVHLEFTIEQFKELKIFAEELGLIFSASAMDKISFDQLNEMKLKFIKIGSGDTNNIPMMRYIAQQKTPLIVSTGMQTEATVKKVHDILQAGNVNFALLHCISSYPTLVEDTQLNYIKRYQKLFPETTIGYSGHESNSAVTLLAVLMGAKIIERHFTIDKNQKGSDHSLSLTPNEMKDLVTKIRFIEKIQVNENILEIVTKNKLFLDPEEVILKACKPVVERVIFPCELNCRNKLGKSIVYTKNLMLGHTLSDTDITIKVSEPPGIPAEYFEDAINKTLRHDVFADNALETTDISEFLSLF
ncbi:unnamed protein product [Diamesa hyperborea]